MNKNNSALAIDLVMIITSFCLMQWHSIKFWSAAAGSSGWAWSIGLEIAMLCLWYYKKHYSLRYIAAIVLIAGPWYQMTSPAILSIQTTNSIETEIEIETERFDQLSKSLSLYESNSATIRGWAGRIDRTQKSKDELSSQIKELHSELSKRNSQWREYMVTAVQSAALLIILTAQLSAVSNRGIKHPARIKSSAPAIHPKSKPKRPAAEISKVTTKFLDEILTSNFEDFDETVEAVAAEIIQELPNHDSQKALAEILGTGQKSISLILNHEKRKLSGTERISSNALNKVLKGLEMHRQSSPE